MQVARWPRHLRHSRQLRELVTNETPEYGDIVHIDYHRAGFEPQAHTALYVAPNHFIHVDGTQGVVAKGLYQHRIIGLYTVSLEALLAEI